METVDEVLHHLALAVERRRHMGKDEKLHRPADLATHEDKFKPESAGPPGTGAFSCP